MEIERRQIPNRLRMHRKLTGYSQKQVAAILAIHPAQLSQWEHGVKMPSGIQLIKLSIIYHTLPTELYFDTYQELKKQIKHIEWELFGEKLPNLQPVNTKHTTDL